MSNILKNKNGITLIALVVTIVVLLILAGVSISLILDNNGIIQKSKDAKKQYEQARTKEEQELDKISGWIDQQVEDNAIRLPDSTEETKPYLPSEDFSKDDDTSLDNGLVIKDSKGNEFVWIEVPRKKEIYQTAGLDIKEFSEEELDKIKTDLIDYSVDYKTSYSDEWYSGCGIINQEKYTTMYNKMLKSIYTNGGFWLGRYEIGIDENTARNYGGEYTIEHSISGQTPVIKANKIPYNWIRCYQAEEMAESFAPSEYTSSLLFGIQWNLVCKHLETKGTNPGATASSLQEAIKSNSTDWGNYSNASFTVTNTKAMYSEDKGATWKKITETSEYPKKENECILLTTGADARNSMMNIYDFAGNVWEWNLEKTTNDSTPGVGGGGDYCNLVGYSYPASKRGGMGKNFNGSGSGARVTLY